MKKSIIVIAAMLFTCGTMFAQQKGDMEVGGILGINGGSSKTTVTVGSTSHKGDAVPSKLNFGINAEFGYFFADNWKISADLGYSLESEPTDKDGDKWLRNNTNVITIGPSISYYLNIAGDFYYTPAFGFYGAFGNYKSDITSSTVKKLGVTGFGIQLDLAACEFRPTSHFGFSASLFNLAWTNIKMTDNDSDPETSAKTSSIAVNFMFSPQVGVHYYF